MSSWNDLFLNNEFVNTTPQAEVHKFILNLQQAFPEDKIKVWDQCCGAGRHSVLAAKLNCSVYSTDISPNGISNLESWLKSENLTVNYKISDMTDIAWPGIQFHGAICWDALHHNTIGNIDKAVDIIYNSLLKGGFFICTLMSIRSGPVNKGKEIEENTFVSETGDEAGVPHHYFSQTEIEKVFKKWNKIVIGEKVVNYLEKTEDFYKTNPFGYTKWELYLRK